MNNEKCLMGIILNNPEKFSDIKIYGNVFTDKNCREIYDIIKDKTSFTGMTVLNHVTDNNTMDLSEYYEIFDGEYEKDKFKIYLDEILSKRMRIDLLNYLHENKTGSTQELKHGIGKITDDITTHEEGEIQDSKKACHEIMTALSEDKQPKRIYSGIGIIDSDQGGYEPGEYTIIGAGESEGKTSYIIGRMIEQLKNNIKVGFISSEMTTKQIYKLMACYISGIDSQKLNNNKLTNVEKESLVKPMERLYEMPIYIVDSIDRWDIVKKNIRIMKNKYDVDIIYIDYLQMIETKSDEKEYDEIRVVSRGLKKLALELEIPIVVLSCITKAGKEGDPQSHHIRGNGKVANDADIIIMMKTENWAINDDYNKRLVKFFMCKNRNGKKQDFQLIFHCPTRRFNKYI